MAGTQARPGRARTCGTGSHFQATRLPGHGAVDGSSTSLSGIVIPHVTYEEAADPGQVVTGTGISGSRVYVIFEDHFHFFLRRSQCRGYNTAVSSSRPRRRRHPSLSFNQRHRGESSGLRAPWRDADPR